MAPASPQCAACRCEPACRTCESSRDGEYCRAAPQLRAAPFLILRPDSRAVRRKATISRARALYDFRPISRELRFEHVGKSVLLFRAAVNMAQASCASRRSSRVGWSFDGAVRLLPRQAARSATAPRWRSFIDENAAFLVQKGIYEYSRARAGHYAKVLFREAGIPGGRRGVALARLSARARDGRARWSKACCALMSRSSELPLEALSALVLAVFDRYPVPPALGRGGLAQSSAPNWRAGCS